MIVIIRTIFDADLTEKRQIQKKTSSILSLDAPLSGVHGVK